MTSVLDALRSAPDFIGGNGRPEEEIQAAEQVLGLSFAPDYREYLRTFGLACFDGHELTGICKASRLNVVDVTLEERKHFPAASGWYVVEQANIDGIVIWQSPDGEIYQTTPGHPPRKLCYSLTEYIQHNF